MPISTTSKQRIGDALAFLLSGEMLWGTQYAPENARLVRRLWPKLSRAQATVLTDKILAGPPGRDRHRDYAIASYLAELRSAAGKGMSARAKSFIAKVEAEHGPVFPESERVFGMRAITSFGGSDQSDFSEPAMAALGCHGLADLLAEHPPATSPFHDVAESRLAVWRSLASHRPVLATATLKILASRDVWPVDVWQAALLGFESMSEKPRIAVVFRLTAPLLLNSPVSFLTERQAAWAIGFWLPGAAKAIPTCDESLFMALWDRLDAVFAQIAIPLDGDRDPLNVAINQAPGRLAEALLWRFFEHKPKIGGGIPDEVRPRLTRLLTRSGTNDWLGRVILARHLAALFSTEPAWAQEFLIPRFNWSVSPEAATVWRGFMAGGSIDPAVFGAIQPFFLDTLRNHDTEVHKSTELLWHIFVLVSLEIPGSIPDVDAQDLLRTASSEARRFAAVQIGRMMPDDPVAGAKFWRERVGPWLATSWPGDLHLRTAECAVALAIVVSMSGLAFPEALASIEHLLVPSDRPLRLGHKVVATKLPEQAPYDVLRILAAVVAPSAHMWGASDIRTLLRRVADADESLVNDSRYIDLDTQLRRQGQ